MCQAGKFPKRPAGLSASAWRAFPPTSHQTRKESRHSTGASPEGWTPPATASARRRGPQGGGRQERVPQSPRRRSRPRSSQRRLVTRGFHGSVFTRGKVRGTGASGRVPSPRYTSLILGPETATTPTVGCSERKKDPTEAFARVRASGATFRLLRLGVWSLNGVRQRTSGLPRGSGSRRRISRAAPVSPSKLLRMSTGSVQTKDADVGRDHARPRRASSTRASVASSPVRSNRTRSRSTMITIAPYRVTGSGTTRRSRPRAVVCSSSGVEEPSFHFQNASVRRFTPLRAAKSDAVRPLRSHRRTRRAHAARDSLAIAAALYARTAPPSGTRFVERLRSTRAAEYAAAPDRATFSLQPRAASCTPPPPLLTGSVQNVVAPSVRPE
jgi:hypothetical protein